MVAQFSKKEAIKFGWKTFKKNIWFLVGVFFVAWVIPQIPNWLTDKEVNYVSDSIVVNTVGTHSLISWLLGLFIQVGIIKIALKFVNGQKPAFADLVNHYSKLRLVWNYIAASVIYWIAVGVGIVLLIIPGVYLAMKYQFYSYFVVEKGMGPIQALKASGGATKGVKINLLLFTILLMIINIVGVLALLVGLLVTIPVTSLAHAWVYKKLSS